MLPKLSTAITAITCFTNRHHILDTTFSIHTVGELKNESNDQSSFWSTFEKKSGVYIFFSANAEHIIYVGMSMSDAGTRLFQWIFPKNGASQYVETDIVLNIIFENEEYYYMAPALESYLIRALNPEKNKKI